MKKSKIEAAETPRRIVMTAAAKFRRVATRARVRSLRMVYSSSVLARAVGRGAPRPHRFGRMAPPLTGSA